jgi:hypothetical protein
MGVPGSANLLLLGGDQGYKIERSLRFNSADSAYLINNSTRTVTAGAYTLSFWVKRSSISGSSQAVWSSDDASGASNKFVLVHFGSDEKLYWYHYTSADADAAQSNGVLRDPSAWYHIVISKPASAAGTMYINGQAQTKQTTQTLDSDAFANTKYIGRRYDATRYFNGYLTEIHAIDGQALTPSSFGETDAVTGVWKPKKYAGTYGTNGFYLNFSDNSGTTSTTLGKDSSGNGNNWTPNNFSVTAGAGNDSMIDTPTPYADGGNGRGNYATLNPLDQYSGNLMNGNLEFAGTYAGQNGIGCRGTLAVPSSGKWYAEATNVTYSGFGNSCMLGFTSSEQSISATALSGTLTPWIGVDASVYNNRITLQWVGVSGGTAASTQLFASYASGDVVNFAIDFSNGKLWVGKNGTWYNSGDPAAGTNATSTFTAGTNPWRFWAEYVVSSDNSNRSSVVTNFGQRPFAYTPPSGFVALNTQNLPEPSIKKPNTYMDAILWTGNGVAGRSITGLNFSPDLVWLKNRSDTYSHQLHDAVRGASSGALYSNLTNAQDSNFPLTSFDSAGFTLGNTASLAAQSQGSQNYNGNGFVAWCWDESATPGFDIVTYTGDGTTSANRLIDHSLGVKPDFVITKKRSGGTDYGWSCWHKDLGGNYGIWLNQTSARNGSMWAGYSNFSSTKFTPPDLLYGNENGATYVNYLWSEVAGFSKFGSYTGNGSTDGPFCFCGFRPRWILMKSSTNAATPWQIFDAVREPENTVEQTLIANGSNSEPYDTASPVDFLSNGFKLRGGAASYNNYNTGTWIFAAFAESPFKYSLAR